MYTTYQRIQKTQKNTHTHTHTHTHTLTHTHTHTQKPLVCLVTTSSFSMPSPSPPVPTTPDTLCCVLMAWKCAAYVRGKEPSCIVMTYAMGIQLFVAEGHNRYCGLIHGLHVGGGMVHAIPNCLIIVKFLKYTHNLQMWPRATNTTQWAASQRPMSYANSFTDSTVDSNIHFLIFT